MTVATVVGIAMWVFSIATAISVVVYGYFQIQKERRKNWRRQQRREGRIVDGDVSYDGIKKR